MKKNEILRVNKLKSRIYNKDMDIDYIIKELMNLLPKEEEGQVLVENVLGRAFYEKGEYQKSIYYYQKALEKKPENLPSFLGLFKNCTQLKNWKKAFTYIQLYKEYSIKENKVLDVTLWETILQNILFSSFQQVSMTSYYFEVDLKDDAVYPLYKSLLEQYNHQNYRECLIISRQLEKENNRLKLDFSILSFLIEQEMKNQKIQNLDNAYQILESAYHNQDNEGMIRSLKLICNFSLQKREFVFHSLYVLATNHYGEQVKRILSSIQLLSKEEKKYIQIIQNVIQNQEAYKELSKEDQVLCQETLDYGSNEYQQGNKESAYEAFKYTYDETKQPIFLYYTGKMLYKMKEYAEAEKYLLKYVQCGDNKIGKAYLYLCGIAYKNHNWKKSAQYASICHSIGKLYGVEYRIMGAEIFDEEDDILKLEIQRKEMKYPRFENS